MENNPIQQDNQITAIVKTLKTEFWIWTIALAVLAILSFWFGPKMSKLDGDATISLQSLLLVILFTGFPGIFVWFRNRMQQLSDEMDLNKRLRRYELFSRLRQAVFFLFGFLILLVQVFTVLKGGIMLFLIVVVLGMFILPSRARLLMETHLLPADQEAAEEGNEEDTEEDETN